MRARLHAAWLQEQDQDDMARVVAGVRRGWQRPGAANGLFDDDEVRALVSCAGFRRDEQIRPVLQAVRATAREHRSMMG